MNKLTLYVVRHGKTVMNSLDRVQGWCDSPLTAEGIESARHLGLGLNDIQFDAAYCSDLRRTHQTIHLILDAKNQADLPVIEKAGFREASFGSYEGNFNYTMWNDAALFLGFTSREKMYDAIRKGEISYSHPLDAIHKIDKDKMATAENFAQVEQRSQLALKEVAEKELLAGSANVLIVAHGMSILALLQNLGGDNHLKSHLENASVCKVEYQNGQFNVLSMGDLSYLEKGRLTK